MNNAQKLEVELSGLRDFFLSENIENEFSFSQENEKQ